MKKHNALYYVFLWDYKKNKLSLEKIELIQKAFIKKFQTVNPKQHSPPISNTKE